jgi:hypothetical protein
MIANLHAASLHPRMIASIKGRNSPFSWRQQQPNALIEIGLGFRARIDTEKRPSIQACAT